MTKTAATIFLLLALSAAPARASDIPQFALDKFYENCLGGEGSDQARVAYCHCMRDAMNGWSDNDFSTMLEEQMKNPSQPPAKLDAQAKICVQKVLK